MARTGVKLLWGTANLFSHPRYAAGAATNPDPEVFAYAAAQVKAMLEATQRLGGANYVLWGGREGYETLLNTDLAREEAQLARFLTMVAEHKHQIGFKGLLLIEPKPQEPTKHQYDYDGAAVHGFLARHDLDGEYRLNLEVNHATLAGHSFHHEVAYAIAHGIFGSVDANRGDYQNGWDTDQFPNSVDELSLAVYEIVRAGGFTTGGFNFDTKLRRQSMRPDGPVPRPYRWDRHARQGPARRGRGDRARDPRAAPRRALRRMGGRPRPVDPVREGSPRGARRPGGQGRDRSAPGIRPAGASRERREPAYLGRRRTRDDRDGRRRLTPMGHVLGIDVSTTATKAVLIDESGRVVGIGVAEYGFDVPRPLWSEQAPALWWDGAVAAIRSVLATTGVTGEEIACIGLTGQMHGAVLLDEAGSVLRPAILWNDQRTGAECDAIRAAVGPDRLVEITGNDALTGFTAPKLVWVRDHEPDVWRRIAHVLLPKDYLRLRLTGEYALDKADGAGTLLFDLAARDWSGEVLAALRIDPAWLPRTWEGPEVTGAITAEAASATGLRPGTPVVAGGGDQAANAVGVGVVTVARWRSRSARRAWSSRPPMARSTSRAGESMPSATRSPVAGT